MEDTRASSRIASLTLFAVTIRPAILSRRAR
jgi:hypothetical protein